MTESLNKVIARINATYGSWHRETSIRTMRDDWDQLFAPDDVAAVVEDVTVNETVCRWAKAPAINSPAVVLYVHGGGFRLGSVDSHLRLMSDIACEAQCQVLGFNYDLLPEAVFPTALGQALGIYRWLLEHGHNAQHIVFAGDSAGGSIAAGLQQLIKQENDEALPQPAGCVLLSAWLDMTLSGESYETREAQDPVHQTKMLAAIAKQYADKQTNLEDPLLSPLFGDLGDLPPTLLQAGEHEIGLDDSVAYAEKLEAAGSRADLGIWPNMIHVFQMYPDDLAEAEEAIGEIGSFIGRVVPKTVK